MDGEAPPAAPPGGACNTLMLPWFLGGSWVPKFSGNQCQQPFSEWQNQIETFLRAQQLSEEQKVDFVLNALQGEARREMVLLKAEERNTAENLLKALKKLYGEHTSLAQLRTQFFTCKQQADEGVGLFILRLRECLCRWRAKEEGVAAADDEMLKSQLVLGLRPGPVQVELQRLLRRESGMTFADVCKEAKAVEKEHNAPREEVGACQAYVAPVSTRPQAPAKPAMDWQELRDSLRKEILTEMGSQLAAMQETLLKELKSQRETLPPLPTPAYEAVPATSSWAGPNRQRRPRRPERGPQWDEQGRPICLRCGQAGHMQRNCTSARPSSQDF